MTDMMTQPGIFTPQQRSRAGLRAPNDNKAWSGLQKGVAGLAIILLLPLFCALFLAVKLTSKGPFLYKQLRPGKDGVLFFAYKIRTMRVGADKDQTRARQVTNADPMVTPIGRLLRDLKLDELPQLYNVFNGDMALVGPRPIAQSLQDELEREIPGFRHRLSVKPGVTSLPQVCILDSGAQTDVVDDWRIRFEAEAHYLAHRSVGYDIAVIGLTLLFLMRKVWRKAQRPAKAISRITAGLLILTVIILTSACAERLSTAPFKEIGPAYQRNIQAYGTAYGAEDLQIEPISVDPLEAADEEDDVYRLGAGDVLRVNIFGEPGLDALEVRVAGDGSIQLPFIGARTVTGLTAADVQQDLVTAYQRQYKNPWVVVQVAQYKSRPVNLIGQFRDPGIYYLDGRMDILKAVALARGFTPTAYLKGARLWRDDQIAPVDLYALLEEGRPDFNLSIRQGDTIYIPSKADQRIYVLGAVQNAGAVSIGDQPMTLLKALSEVGGPVKSAALLSQVRIIRTVSAVDGQLILVNAKSILKGNAPDLPLKADDIIYVPDNLIESWNQALRAITPSLQMAGGVLQPFVQIKFLKGES